MEAKDTVKNHFLSADEQAQITWDAAFKAGHEQAVKDLREERKC